MGVAAALGPWDPATVWEEIRARVPGYAIPVDALAAGGAVQTSPQGRDGQGAVVERRAVAPPGLVHSDHNGLFASGTMGRYSKVLNSVMESRLSR